MAIKELQTIVPNIYFEKITLEKTSKTNYQEINPHIDHEREPNMVRNSITKKLEYKTPEADYEKKGQGHNDLIVNINLLIKEKLDNSLIATWITNETLLKYLKVKVVQTTDKNIIDAIIYQRVSLLSNSLLANVNVEVKTKSIKELLTKDSLNQQHSSIDENGNRIYDIILNIGFVVKNSNPKYLAYFAIPYLDAKEISDDYGLNLPSGQEMMLAGKPLSELVISDYNVVSETYVFFDGKGNVWEGLVHMPDPNFENWMSGEYPSEKSFSLEMRIVNNDKVEDFRDVEDIERLQLDFSIIENELMLFDKNIKFLTQDRTDITVRKNYFSNVNMARDSEGNCRFLFGIDFLTLIKENTLFGFLYREDNESLLRYVRISSLKVYRIRISNTPSALKDEDGLAVLIKMMFQS